MIISQSVNPGKKITSKETLTVTVSKGEAIYAPDFSGYSKDNMIAWGTKNNVNIEFIERYSADVEEGKVIEQSNTNKPVNDGMTVTVSLGNIDASSYIGSSIDELNKWKDEVNAKGAGITIHKTDINDDDLGPNKIISISNVGVGKTLEVCVSKGKNILLQDGTISWDDLVGKTEIAVRELCSNDDNKGVTCQFYYVKGDGNQNIIEDKEDGIHSLITQAGTNVSGGQKQRLSIARALGQNKKIYVFDDSFSALDFETDKKLRAELDKVVKKNNSTVFIVAQRISTIMNADKILESKK